jgi:microcystin-dependent protein
MAFKDYISKQGSTTDLLATTSDDGLLSASDKTKLNNVVAGCPFPVNAIYLSVSSTDPRYIWSGTTWDHWGQGRVPLGVGYGTDESNNSFATGSAEMRGGEFWHQLTIAEMPSHHHHIPDDDGTKHNYHGAAFSWGNDNIGHDTNNEGGDGYHNNMQPYITCYMWKRTG